MCARFVVVVSIDRPRRAAVKYYGVQDEVFLHIHHGLYCSRRYVVSSAFSSRLLQYERYRVILLGPLKPSTICHGCFSLQIFTLYPGYCQFDSRVAVVFLRAEDVWSPPNMALNKPTAQSSTYIHGSVPLSAEYAVDGIQHRTLTTTRPCAHTDGGTYPWWVVDLGQSSLVSEVWIVSRIDGKFTVSSVFPLSQSKVESK